MPGQGQWKKREDDSTLSLRVAGVKDPPSSRHPPLRSRNHNSPRKEPRTDRGSGELGVGWDGGEVTMAQSCPELVLGGKTHTGV